MQQNEQYNQARLAAAAILKARADLVLSGGDDPEIAAVNKKSKAFGGDCKAAGDAAVAEIKSRIEAAKQEQQVAREALLARINSPEASQILCRFHDALRQSEELERRCQFSRAGGDAQVQRKVEIDISKAITRTAESLIAQGVSGDAALAAAKKTNEDNRPRMRAEAQRLRAEAAELKKQYDRIVAGE